MSHTTAGKALTDRQQGCEVGGGEADRRDREMDCECCVTSGACRFVTLVCLRQQLEHTPCSNLLRRPTGTIKYCQARCNIQQPEHSKVRTLAAFL